MIKNFKHEYIIHIRNLKQALNKGLVVKKVHRLIKLNQCLTKTIHWYKYWPKKKSKKWFCEIFFLSWKIMQFSEKLENVRKHRIVNLPQQKEE